MKKPFRRLILGLAVWAVVIWFALPFYGTHQVIPGLGQGTPDGVLPPDPGYALVSFTTANGIRLAAEFAPALTGDGHPLADPAAQPTLLYFYGADQMLATRATQSQIRYFRTMGVNVLMPDLPGYGMSGGHPSEGNFSAAADAAYDYLRAQPGGAGRRIFIGGSSRGTGTAIALASRREVAGLISMAGFTSIRDMGYGMYPRIPRWLVRRALAEVPFDNAAAIPKVSCPILIVHGTADARVPPVMADQLAAAAAKVTLIKVPGADHDDIGKVGGTKLWTAIRDWLAAQRPAPAA